MPRPTRALLAAPLMALAACAATSSAASAPATTAHMPGGQTAALGVPQTARMICDDEIRSKVQQALKLGSPPATHDTWAGGVYTCHYSLPMGEMTLTDRVFPDAAAARTRMATQQADDGKTTPLAGLGQQAYGNDRGVAVVLRDDQILTVDTTGLPERFGANGQKRTDLAYEVASDVLGCWTGDE